MSRWALEAFAAIAVGVLAPICLMVAITPASVPAVALASSATGPATSGPNSVVVSARVNAFVRCTRIDATHVEVRANVPWSLAWRDGSGRTTVLHGAPPADPRIVTVTPQALVTVVADR
jgi:hypothetical protein